MADAFLPYFGMAWAPGAANTSGKFPHFPPQKDPIIIAIDFKTHCMPESARRTMFHTEHGLTEAGMAILDTRDIAGIAPGDRGSNWFSKFQHYHWRISENVHLAEACKAHQQPKPWHKGQAESFIFDTPEWVSLQDFASDFNTFLAMCSRNRADPAGAQRNIICLTFGSGKARQTATDLGLDLLARPNCIAHIDLQSHAALGAHLAAAARLPKHAVLGLGRYCAAAGLPTLQLHNAGNDAAFTLQAFVATALMTKAQYAAFGRQAPAMLPQTWPVDWVDADPFPWYEGEYIPRKLRRAYDFLTAEQKERFGHKPRPVGRQGGEAVKAVQVGRLHGRKN